MSKKEWLKNLKPLEALEQLKNIPIYETSMYGEKYYYEGRLYDIYLYKRMVNIIKHALEDYEKLKAQDENNKKLKALETIKKILIMDDDKQRIDVKNCVEMSDDEYDLLKEVLL